MSVSAGCIFGLSEPRVNGGDQNRTVERRSKASIPGYVLSDDKVDNEVIVDEQDSMQRGKCVVWAMMKSMTI